MKTRGTTVENSIFRLPEGDFAGYIFDCDGTLADTMPLHFSAWQRALSEHGARFTFTWDLFMSRAGMSRETTVLELARQFSVSLPAEAIAAAQKRYFEQLAPEAKPVEEVAAFVRAAVGHVPMSVASGNDRASVEQTLRQLKLSDCFSVVITSQDVARGKPHPDMFVLAAERMNVERQRCLVFEDSPLGIEAAARAGMHGVLVTPRSAQALSTLRAEQNRA